MAEKVVHTPLPWRWESAALLGPNDSGLGFDGCVLRTLGNCGPEPDDEAFIVRAVNSHYQLLEALERCEFQTSGVARLLREWPGTDPHRPLKEVGSFTFGRLLDFKQHVVSLDDATQTARAAIAASQVGL